MWDASGPCCCVTLVNLTRLPSDKKQFVWQWLQDNKPDLAQLIGSQGFKDAQKAFSGQVMVELKSTEIEDMKKKIACCAQQGV